MFILVCPFWNLKILNFFSFPPLIWLHFTKTKTKTKKTFKRTGQPKNWNEMLNSHGLLYTVRKIGVSITTATGVSASDTNWKASRRGRATKKSHLKCNTRWLMIQYFIIKNTFWLFFTTTTEANSKKCWTELKERRTKTP